VLSSKEMSTHAQATAGVNLRVSVAIPVPVPGTNPYPHPWRVYPQVQVLVSAIYKILCKINFTDMEMSSITNAREQVQVLVLDFSQLSFAPKQCRWQ